MWTFNNTGFLTSCWGLRCMRRCFTNPILFHNEYALAIIVIPSFYHIFRSKQWTLTISAHIMNVLISLSQDEFRDSRSLIILIWCIEFELVIINTSFLRVPHSRCFRSHFWISLNGLFPLCRRRNTPYCIILSPWKLGSNTF